MNWEQLIRCLLHMAENVTLLQMQCECRGAMIWTRGREGRKERGGKERRKAGRRKRVQVEI